MTLASPPGAARALTTGSRLAAATLPAATPVSAVTGADGSYLFTGLAPGRYQVTASATIAGFDRTSDTDGALDWMVAVDVPAGTVGVADFAGLGHGAVVGSLVESTSNAPLASGTVRCVWAGYDDVLDTADDVAFETTTDADGSFAVAGVPYGEYRCLGVDQAGRLSVPAEAAVYSAAPVDARLPVDVAASDPVPVQTKAAAAPARTAAALPRTGSDVRALVVLGLTWTAAGAALVSLARRRLAD